MVKNDVINLIMSSFFWVINDETADSLGFHLNKHTGARLWFLWLLLNNTVLCSNESKSRNETSQDRQTDGERRRVKAAWGDVSIHPNDVLVLCSSPELLGCFIVRLRNKLFFPPSSSDLCTDTDWMFHITNFFFFFFYRSTHSQASNCSSDDIGLNGHVSPVTRFLTRRHFLWADKHLVNEKSSYIENLAASSVILNLNNLSKKSTNRHK